MLGKIQCHLPSSQTLSSGPSQLSHATATLVKSERWLERWRDFLGGHRTRKCGIQDCFSKLFVAMLHTSIVVVGDLREIKSTSCCLYPDLSFLQSKLVFSKVVREDICPSGPQTPIFHLFPCSSYKNHLVCSSSPSLQLKAALKKGCTYSQWNA